MPHITSQTETIPQTKRHYNCRSIHPPKALAGTSQIVALVSRLTSWPPLGSLALTDDRVRENPWRKLETAPSRQAAADRAAMRLSWHDSRIMPFLAGTAGVTNLEVIHFGWMNEERPRSQERSYWSQDGAFTLVWLLDYPVRGERWTRLWIGM